jgi:hypothetical protein
MIPLENVKRKICCKFPGITVPIKAGIHEVINKSQVYWITSGHEMHKNTVCLLKKNMTK